MYIPDGTDKDYAGHSENCYAWGWLSSEHEFNTGWDSDEKKFAFVGKLATVRLVDLFRGVHTDKGLGLDYMHSANGSLKILHNGTTFVAPKAVSYYVSELDYRPPDEVIEAVFNGEPLAEQDDRYRRPKTYRTAE